MNKHTPGPWLRDGRTVYALNEDGTNAMLCQLIPGHVPGYDPEEVQLANARLIQQALKMLKALEAIKARIDGEWDHPALVEYGELHTNPVKDVLSILESTIYEAKGE